MADGSVVFEIKGDNSNLKSTLADTTQEIKTESAKWDSESNTAATNIETKWTDVFKKISLGAAALAIGKYLIDLGGEAINLASDLEEVQNVVDVTFGENAKTIDDWAARAGKDFGLTRLQAKRYASSIGAALKSSGIDADITEVSTDLAGLAADMASFYNMDFDTSFQKIMSGVIAGQTEPLRALGINMSVATLEAYRLERGLDTAYEKMSDSEKTLLRYQYIMDATADAQGDFARTQDGYANSMRKLETTIDELKTTLGEILIGPMTEIVQTINKFLSIFLPGEKSIAEQFAEINGEAEKTVDETSALADEARSYTSVLAELGSLDEIMAGIAAGAADADLKYAQWMATCQALVGIIPELSAVINTQTGEIEGGTAAVDDWVNSWEKRRKTQAIEEAVAAKTAALEEQYGKVFDIERDLGIAQIRAKNAREAFEAKGGAERYQELMDMGNNKTEADWEEMWNLGELESTMLAYEEQANALSVTLAESQDAIEAATQELKEWSEAAMEWAGLTDESDDAKAGAEATVNGIATGIDAAIPNVAASVASLNAVLSGIGTPQTPAIIPDGFIGPLLPEGYHASGLDYVPHDDYLASLHEGESILTAEEAKVWRAFKNGGVSSRNSLDYGALSGAIWTNAPSMGGGNVYLDGQTVGRVISARQADSYRALQRSGWMAQ